MKARNVVAVTVLATLCSAPAALGQTAYHWGSYMGGPQGTAFTQTSPAPALTEVVAVQASNSSGYALRADGTVWAWGYGARGQLGNGELENSPETPVQVAFPPGVKIVSLGEAKNEAFAIDSEGHGWGWGANSSQALCTPGLVQPNPLRVPGLEHLVQVQGGQEHVFWLTREGNVYVCGRDQHTLGLGENVIRTKGPTQLNLSNIVQVSAGADYTAALNKQGQIYTWGDNLHGEVGIGSREETIWTPHRVELPEPAKSVSAGGDLDENGATLALSTSGAVWGWGDDHHGEIGDGSMIDKPLPVNTGLHFVQAVTGGAESFGLTGEGNLYGWGSNVGGDLGIGNEVAEKVLEPMLLQTGVSSVSATAKNVEDLR